MRQSAQFRIGGPLTPVVKNLMIINGGVFIFQQLTGLIAPGFIENVFGLNHQGLALEFKLWQIFTYMFLHGGWLHILFNLLGLWMFAGDLENLWGGKTFLRYYITAGVGAGVFIAVMNFFTYHRFGPGALPPYAPTTLGASGAIYGILLAYGLTWPNREVLLYFVFPVKIKYLLILFGVMEFFGTLSSAAGAGGNISYIGHLGGLLTGIIYFLFLRRRGFRSASQAGHGVIDDFLKKQRLKKKRKEIEDRIEAKKIIDRLLDKIAREGMSSLTAEEKKNLEWARRHYYPENNETLH
mgnify:CR=1 FL=1